MQESRELDAEIAEKLFGWTDIAWMDNVHGVRGVAPRAFLGTAQIVPRYSSDIAAAFLVVEKMRERRVLINLGQLFNEVSDMWGSGTCWLANAHVYGSDSQVDHFQAVADTAPLAICLAALQALGTSSETSEGKR
jgi:hypothetical protein